MPYSAKIKATVKASPKTLGSQLARTAIRKKISVVRVAQHTGASRTTVYSWFAGRGVTNAYAAKVRETIKLINSNAL